MQDDVSQVVGPRSRPCHQVVDPEGQGDNWPVRLVTARVGERGAPEVVWEDVTQTTLAGCHVIVLKDGPPEKDFMFALKFFTIDFVIIKSTLPCQRVPPRVLLGPVLEFPT